MKAFNYYKTRNNCKSGIKPYLYFEDCPAKCEYKGLFVLNGVASEFLVYDGVIISERVKVHNDLIDDFLNPESDSFDRIRMMEAYTKAKAWLSN